MFSLASFNDIERNDTVDVVIDNQYNFYEPSDDLKTLDANIPINEYFVYELLKQYIIEVITEEDNVFFPSMTYDKHNTEHLLEKFKDVIKILKTNSKLLNDDILYEIIHETHIHFPNLFNMYRVENPQTLLTISCGIDRNNNPDLSYHSEDNGVYERWVLGKLMTIEF